MACLSLQEVKTGSIMTLSFLAHMYALRCRLETHWLRVLSLVLCASVAILPLSLVVTVYSLVIHFIQLRTDIVQSVQTDQTQSVADIVQSVQTDQTQ